MPERKRAAKKAAKKAASKKVAVKKVAVKKPAGKKAAVKKVATKAAGKSAPLAGESGGVKDKTPDESEIRTAAYLNYLARSQKALPGDEMADWLKAQEKPGS